MVRRTGRGVCVCSCSGLSCWHGGGGGGYPQIKPTLGTAMMNLFTCLCVVLLDVVTVHSEYMGFFFSFVTRLCDAVSF